MIVTARFVYHPGRIVLRRGRPDGCLPAQYRITWEPRTGLLKTMGPDAVKKIMMARVIASAKLPAYIDPTL